MSFPPMCHSPRRDGARQVLVSMAVQLGAQYLPYVIQVLTDALPERGYTAHVLGYTVHAVVAAIKEVWYGGGVFCMCELVCFASNIAWWGLCVCKCVVYPTPPTRTPPLQYTTTHQPLAVYTSRHTPHHLLLYTPTHNTQPPTWYTTEHPSTWSSGPCPAPHPPHCRI